MLIIVHNSLMFSHLYRIFFLQISYIAVYGKKMRFHMCLTRCSSWYYGSDENDTFAMFLYSFRYTTPTQIPFMLIMKL